jgi:hypothetical protein
MEIQPEWIDLVGDLRAPLRKISREEKQRLRSFIRKTNMQALRPAWHLRLSLAAGMVPISAAIDGSVLLEALSPQDIARNLEKLQIEQRIVGASAALIALETKVDSHTSGVILASLLRLAHHRKQKTAKDFKTSSPPRIEPETATAMLRIALKVMSLLARNPSKTPGQKREKRRAPAFSSYIDLAFLIAARCEHPRVAGVAIELLHEIEKGAGWAYVEQLSDVTAGRRLHLVQLPAALIGDVLRRGCLADADYLATRVRLVDDTREQFHAAVVRLLNDQTAQIALTSRIWAETFLVPDKASRRTPPGIAADSEANVDRLAMLLLACWESRNEGSRSMHLFELFGSVCRTAFHLSLAGEVQVTLPFDPAVHEVYKGTVEPGQDVTVIRPWVQWSEGPVVRVIVRALVVANM